MSNKPKHPKDHAATTPHENARDKYERHIDGDISVRGQIETHLPPDLRDKQDTERKEDKTHKKKDYRVSLLTLIAVAIYAGLTFWQGCLTRNLVLVSQRTYDASQRPYVGINVIRPQYLWIDAAGVASFEEPRPKEPANGLQVEVEFKNFGPVPGSNFIAKWKVYVGNTEAQMNSMPTTPTTIFPSQLYYLKGSFAGPEYQSVLRGEKILHFTVNIKYSGPGGDYGIDCTARQYSPDLNGFFDLGPCDKF